MAKKQEYQEKLFDFLDNKEIKIPNPLCIRIRMESRGFQSQTIYYRYVEDGRYEMLSTSRTSTSIQYGIYYDTNIKEKEQYWLKTLYYRSKNNLGGQSLITNEEFEEAKDLYMIVGYEKYLKGIDETFKEDVFIENKEEYIEERPLFLNKPKEDAPF